MHELAHPGAQIIGGTSRKKHFFEMKDDVGMWLVQIMKKEGNKTTTTTNTSYSIPTSFVGTYPWVYVKDVGMEYDVFVVVVSFS